MTMEQYLGFRIGDEVLDAAELTAGTARIKEFRIVPDELSFGMTVVAVMENGAERFVTQLKKVRPDLPEQQNVVALGGRDG
jgi:hypothetical protein